MSSGWGAADLCPAPYAWLAVGMLEVGQGVEVGLRRTSREYKVN